MEPKTYVLKHPIKIGTQDITALTASRRLKAKDFKEFPLDPKLGDLAQLLSAICNEPLSTINELDGTDYMGAIKEFSDFLPSGAATGQTA